MKEYKAEDLIEKLRNRYGHEAYVVFEQVADCTGAAYQSWIDAVVIGLWPSKGLMRSAFEIKVSRNDYLREIQNPRKNAWARECFHEFWYVAPKGVINTPDELPEGCGWMAPHGKTLKIVKAARRLENPTIDDSLVASLARSFQDDKQTYFRTAKAEVLKNSREHQNALACKNAVKRFINDRDGYYYGNESEEEVFKMLVEATFDKEVQHDREQVIEYLQHFQEKITGLFETFAVLAHVSLLERNEAGKFVVSRWGGFDEEMIENLRKKIKDENKRDRRRKDEKISTYDFLSDCAAAVMKSLGKKKVSPKAKKIRSGLTKLLGE